MEGMNQILLIGIIVLVIVLVIVAIVAIGLSRKKSKTVSFEKEEQDPKELTAQEKSGNYQAVGGFNFAPAKTTEPEPEVLPGQQLGQSRPAEAREPEVAPTPEPDVATAAEPTPGSALTPEPAPAPAPAPTPKQEPEVKESVVPGPVPTPAPDVKKETGPQKSEQPQKSSEPDPAAAGKATVPTPAPVPPSTEDRKPQQPTPEPEQPAAEIEEVEVSAAVAETIEQQETPTPPSVDAPEEPAVRDADPVDVEKEAEEAAEAAQVTAEVAEAAREQTPVPETPAEPAPAPVEEIAPAAGRIGRLRGRLSRSQNVIGQGVLGILSAGDLDEEAWEEIEDTLIMADLGATVTMNVVDSLRDKIAERGVANEAEARQMLRETLIEACRPELDRSIRAMPYEGKPAVVLVVGVNGTGKTTTTGKLARVLVAMGHKVLLGAADTFRAAAADQLETWGRRVGATTVRGKEGADPASVAFDAVARGVEEQADVVLVDTAGRLHTSTGLMDQLGKVKRVVEKKAVVDEVLLVLDATVGQNGLTQARVFREVVDITGVVLTKLDGTAKGGIVFQVQEELGVPVKLVGLGEGSDDLAPFEVEGFVDALLG